MKIRKIWLAAAVLLVLPQVSAVAQEKTGFILALDAGMPLQGAEGRYGADFGNIFMGFSARARLSGDFYLELGLNCFPAARPGDGSSSHDRGLEATVAGLWRIAPREKVSPFFKLGLSYAQIDSTGSGPDRWLGVNAGGGVECRLGEKLLLRLGGAFTVVPNDGEGAVASWGKIFAGLGLRLK